MYYNFQKCQDFIVGTFKDKPLPKPLDYNSILFKKNHKLNNNFILKNFIFL